MLWGQDGAQEIITFAADYDEEGNLKTNTPPRGDFSSIFQPLKDVSASGYGLAMKTFKGALRPDLLNGSSLHKELWTNIMSSQLPNAPNLHKIVVYGRGKATEVGYVLKKEGEVRRITAQQSTMNTIQYLSVTYSHGNVVMVDACARGMLWTHRCISPRRASTMASATTMVTGLCRS